MSFERGTCREGSSAGDSGRYIRMFGKQAPLSIGAPLGNLEGREARLPGTLGGT